MIIVSNICNVVLDLDRIGQPGCIRKAKFVRVCRVRDVNNTLPVCPVCDIGYCINDRDIVGSFIKICVAYCKRNGGVSDVYKRKCREST